MPKNPDQLKRGGRAYWAWGDTIAMLDEIKKLMFAEDGIPRYRPEVLHIILMREWRAIQERAEDPKDTGR